MRDTTSNLQPMNKPTARTWWEIRNAAGDTAEVFIYDQIGEDWWTGNGVTAKAFIDELGQITAPNIDLHLNSPGGSVFDGQAIYNALVRHPARITTYIDGLAASIASVIALAGERVVMAQNALFMIHNPMSTVSGYASDMRKMADVLDKIKSSILGVYENRTNLTNEELAAAMDGETWYTAEEAANAGFVTDIAAAQPIAAKFDLSALGFKHAPLNSVEQPEPVEQVEKISDADGASESDSSGGASDTPQEEVIVKSERYVAGVGFVTFNRK